MVLSVIIVSYNVKYFLEQCLCSVQRAMGPGVEVFVIDNHSSDGTVEYLREKYPFAQFISNDENVGFAKANNQALEMVGGKYVLFLNPDTIIPEDLFSNCLAFMQKHEDAGALGVRMIDGSGKFLKESKRGFPSPWVAFCKMSGLTKFFPRSKTFAGYYLGHLPEKEIHEVDALAGACMFVRKEVLNKIGGFDEQFFMYAEDIDLSYRIQKAGYKNYYLPKTTIVHFKGESTRKDRKYVRLFYKAMVQFSRKHFGKNILLEAAINLRASLARRTNKSSTLGHNINPDAQIFYPLGHEKGVDEIPIGKCAYTGWNSIFVLEGPSCSFRHVIEAVDNAKGKQKIYIHGSGTRSIVGSNEKDGQGQVFSW